MTTTPSKSTTPGMQAVIVLSVVPFPFAILFTILCLLIVGNTAPRQVAPGDGLALAGLATALCVAALVLLLVRRQTADARARQGSLLLLATTTLMSWPVWTVGVLPTINGAMRGPERATTMAIERLEVTTATKSHTLYHWAYLQPATAASDLRAGRYFVNQADHERWTATRATTVQVTHARGALGAEVILGVQ